MKGEKVCLGCLGCTMSQRRKGPENEKNRRKVLPKIQRDNQNFIKQSNLKNETNSSKRVKNKFCISPTENFSKKKRTSKIPSSRKNKKYKNIKNTHLASDATGCSSSPSSSDKTSDSDLIVISEADCGLSEKVSPSSGYSGSSPCNDSVSNLCNDKLPSEIRHENVPIIYKSKCNISVTLNECPLDVEEREEVLPYESAFVATLPNLEVNYESDFSDIFESSKTQNMIKDNSHLNIGSPNLNESILVNNSHQIMSEHCNSLQDITFPNKNLLTLMNRINLYDSKENFICNQLNIKPLIKPPDFNYEENNFADFAVDIAMLRAASNYIKERSKTQIALSSLPNVSKSTWGNSIIKFNDPFLNLSENCLNQINSEDNESEISISSVRTSDIQLDFFDITFPENPETFSEENLSDFNVTLPSPLEANTNNLSGIFSNKQMTDSVELFNNNNDKDLSEVKPKVKRKRKRCIWDTRKRRCKKRQKKKDPINIELNSELNAEDTIPKLNSELNAEDTIPKLNSELNAEIFCDTCDESEVDDDETNSDFFNPIGREKSSSIIDIKPNKKDITKDFEKNEASFNPSVKRNDGRQYQNTQQKKENSSLVQKLYPKRNAKAQDLRNSENLSAINKELVHDSGKENYCDSSNKHNNCLMSTTPSNSIQSDNILVGSRKRRRKENHFENQEENSFLSHETSNECKSTTKAHNSKSKKIKLQKSDSQNLKQLKCSVDLKILSQSREIFNKSNHSPLKHSESSVLLDESTKTTCSNENIKDFNKSSLPQIKLQRLNNCTLEKCCADMGINENGANKSECEDVCPKSTKIISPICDNFVPDQNSENQISDSSFYSKSSSSHIVADHIKNTFNLNKETSEISPYSFLGNISTSDFQKKKYTVGKSSSNATVSDIEVDIENVFSELQENEHKPIAENSSKAVSVIHAEYISKNESLSDSTIKSVLSSLLEKCENSDNSLCVNSTYYSTENSNSVPSEETFCSVSMTTNNYDINDYSNKIVQSDTIIQSEDICSNDLCQELNDYNSDSITAKTCINIQDSVNSITTSNISRIDEESSETKSSSNTEPIIFGLTEDEELDFELDQQDDVKNEDTYNDKSIYKSSADQQKNSFKTTSNSTVGYLNEINSSFNTLYSNISKNENFFDSSNDLQNTFSNFREQESYFSFDDDSDSDKEYSFKRSRERNTNLFEEPLEFSSTFEKATTNLPSKENYQYFENNPDQNNLPSINQNNLSISEQHKSSLSVDDQNNCNIKNDVAASSVNSINKVSSKAFRSLNDVVSEIKECCCKGKGIEAIELAHTYISISSTSDINKFLFKKLLSGLFLLIKNFSNNEISLTNIFDEVLNLMHKFEIYDKKLLSYIVIKCYKHPELTSYTKTIFICCREKNIPLISKAIKALISTLELENVTLSVLLEYIDYIKSVCKKKIPKILIHSALEKSKSCKTQEMHHLCTILYGVTPKEVNELNLKEFLQICLKKSEWSYIADMFKTWSIKNGLSTCIYLALASESEFSAKYYGKLADTVHNNDEALCPAKKLMFGQIGTALMLEAFTRKYLECALEILNILHKYNVNYHELELALCNFYLSQSYTNTFEIKILPFLVVFVAVDICLHFERPKDAFTIFQDFSWVKPSENLDQEVKMYVLKERLHRLIKLVPLLNEKDSLHQGWEALTILLTAVEEGLVQETLEEKNKDHVEENNEEASGTNQTKEKTPVQCMRSIYNEYLISLINFNDLLSAYDLYKHCLGPKKDIFTIKPYVLRGLVVALFNNGDIEKARSIFIQGLMTDVYPVKQPEFSSIPWDFTVKSEWTDPEIKFAVDWFISMLSPLLSAKPTETNFEEWFSLKITFKIMKYNEGSKIECLSVTATDPKYYINKTKNALQNMNPSLQCTEKVGEEALYITSDSLYSYWKSKYCNDSPKLSHFKKSLLFRQKQKRFSFGEINPYEKEISTLFNKKNSLQSPSKLHTNFAENLVSEYIDEIRCKTSSGTLPPVSPETSPTQIYKNSPTKSVGTSFISEKKSSPCTYKNIEGSSQKLSDSIIQISNPNRLMDIPNKEHEIQKEKDSLLPSDRDIRSGSTTNTNKNLVTFSTSNNLKMENKFNNALTASSNMLQIKDVTSINKNSLQKPRKRSLSSNNLKKVKLNSKNLPNGKFDIKNLTVSFTANSSTRIVSNLNSSSCDNLQNSQTLVKTSPQDSVVSKTTKVRVIKEKKMFNKSDIIPEQVTNRNLFNQSATNMNSNLLINVPVSNLNVNRTNQAMKESLFVSVSDTLSEAPDSTSNKKISSTVTSQNRESDTAVSSNSSAQCKISKPLIKRNIAKTSPNSAATVSCTNSAMCKNLKPIINRNNNLTSQDSTSYLKQTSKITQNKDSDTIASSNSSALCKTFKPVIQRNNNLTSRDSDSVMPDANSGQSQNLKPVIKFNANLTSQASISNLSSGISHSKAKVNAVSTNTSSSLTKNSVSFMKKEDLNLEKPKLAEQAKPFSGNSCSPEEFQRIIQFLKMKIAVKHKHLLPVQQHNKALSLAKTFIKINDSITKLDKRTMKMLDEFERVNV